jgi:hypothetical protein
MGCADPELLPPGVMRKHYLHHSEPCPLAVGRAAIDAMKDVANRAKPTPPNSAITPA